MTIGAPNSHRWRPSARGPVMVIGGAEDQLRDKVILSRFAKFAGGDDGHVVVISTASSLGDEATEIYRELFAGLGIGAVIGVRPEEREEADDPDVAALLRDATGVYLTGGNQSRLTQVVAGTEAGRRACSWPTTAGRCSPARAPARAPWRATWWRSATPGPTPKNRMVQLSAGLGILGGLVIDQHFERAGPDRPPAGARGAVAVAPRASGSTRTPARSCSPTDRCT